MGRGLVAQLVVYGGTAQSATVDGLMVSTIYDHDKNPSTPPIDPYLFDLVDSGFKVAELGYWTRVPRPPTSVQMGSFLRWCLI